MARILLIDDDDCILGALAALLRLDGFEVVALCDPGEALVALRRERFDAVVSDLDMPAIDGRRVLAEAHATQSGARLILVTGSEARADLPAGAVRLAKPLPYDALSAFLSAPRD